jgi:hypothetical protein
MEIILAFARSLWKTTSLPDYNGTAQILSNKIYTIGFRDVRRG